MLQLVVMYKIFSGKLLINCTIPYDAFKMLKLVFIHLAAGNLRYNCILFLDAETSVLFDFIIVGAQLNEHLL
jgi:hypothetical protein